MEVTHRTRREDTYTTSRRQQWKMLCCVLCCYVHEFRLLCCQETCGHMAYMLARVSAPWLEQSGPVHVVRHVALTML